MNSLLVSDFSLEYTLDCGQFFLYEKIEDWYYIVNGQSVFKVKEEGGILFYEGIDEEQLRLFFGLDIDISDLKNIDDKYLLEAVEKFWGLRLMKQDLWQCIISFVCSQNSNIPKIKSSLKKICEIFGEKKEAFGKVFYLFPRLGEINDLNKLKQCSVGYRAKYIYDINKILSEDKDLFKNIEFADYFKARAFLKRLSGIGSKVADCICLFGLSHTDAFPIDVWIKRVLEEIYIKKKVSMKEMEKFVESYFGKNRGLKQQYLFYYVKYLK